ncbi:hypothetical protein [Psychrosphaera aestuarii]|uniref:hypothetical protein n=1 Tax=Psychrosphaera aestuarii TaxID=1266052 RepID=UPI001B33F6D7|nr:hypothetical protein [Psychrosphaera aestuarii]
MNKPDKLQRILVRRGENPQRSVRFFLAGLFCFVLGIAGLYLGASAWIWWQIPGIALMIIGVLVTLYGYVGIVANRLAFFRHQAQLNKEKYKHLE